MGTKDKEIKYRYYKHMNEITKLDFEQLYYEHIKEITISYNYVYKQLDLIEKYYNIEKMTT